MGPVGSRPADGELRRRRGDRARLAGGAQARPAADSLAVVRSVQGSVAARLLGARALAHPADAVPQGDHGLSVAVVAGAARGVHEGQSDGRDGGRQLLDWLCDPPGAGADDGRGADGGAGQAQFEAADRSADRGERGSPRAGEGAPFARQRQHGAQQGLPRRGADPDRRQQRRRPALHAGALPLPRRGRRLPGRRRGRGRSDPAGRAALRHLPAPQDPAGVDAEDQGAVPDRAGVRGKRSATVLRALSALP